MAPADVPAASAGATNALRAAFAHIILAQTFTPPPPAFRRITPEPRRDSSLKLAPLPLIATVVSALCLAGALATFLVYPVSAQSENEPLTASFLTDTGPSNHGGAGQTFTIRIRFSEDIATSYRVLRDQALQVEGGVARKFKPVDGSSSLWEIHAEPDSDADVTLTLPATTDCSAAAAVCTASDKPLSERVTTTIPPAPEPTPEPHGLGPVPTDGVT